MKEFNRSLAVTIGINNYKNGIHSLETAKPDAEELARILEQDYHYNQVTLITDDTQIKPTRENLLTLLKTTLPQQNLTESDRLLFYFAGHGIARPSEEETEDGPQGFLVPADAHSDKSDSLIPMRDIYQYLANLRCRHLLVILDCCFAGAFRWASTRKFIYTPKKATKAHYQRFTKFPAWEVITSSAYNQEALDFLNNRRIEQIKSEKHSPFAQALFEGLKGEADLNQDGAIIAPELYIYLRDYVEKNSKEKQTPGFFPLQKHDRGEYIFQIPGRELNLAETPELNPDNNPYRGLKSYDEKHVRFFFGRQKLSQELFKIVSQSERQLTTVVGISGSGKSSLVKAGLIPNLRNIDIRLIYGYWLTLFVLKGYPHFPIQFLPINYIPNPFYIRLISACLLSLAILEVFPHFPLQYLPISYTYQWQILEIIRLGGTPFQELFRTFAPLITEDISVEEFKNNPEKLVKLIKKWGKNNPKCKLLLVIDQFEELIAQAPKEVSNQESSNINQLNKIKNQLFGKQKETKSVSAEIKPEWQQFLGFLVKIIQNSPQLNIVVTLRSDFEPRFAESVLRPHWNRFIVRPMRPDELREVVESPATEMALYFEPANLVDRLVDEVNQTPGALPLLSFTLSELYIKLYEEWQSGIKSDRSLTVDREFEKQGGVAGSLTRRANEEHDSLPDDAHRTTMSRLMLRMVEIEGQEALKRRVLKSELIYPSNEENERVQTVLKSLDNARLIVTGKDRGTGEPYYEPAHDFLVRGWDKLQIWIRQEQENLTLQRLLTPAAVEWNHIEQPPHKVEPLLNFGNMVLDFTYASINAIPTLFNKLRWWNSEEENQKSQKKSRFLWDTNPRLNLLEEVLNSNNNWLSQTEVDFVESSIKRNHRKIATSWNIATVVILGLSGLIFWVLYNLRNSQIELVRTARQTSETFFKSEDQQLEALASALKAGKILQQGRLLQGWLKPSAELQTQVRGTLWKVFYNTQEQSRLWHEDRVNSAKFSSYGNFIVTASGDKTAKVWNLNGKKITILLHEDEVNSAKFSSDGNFIVTASDDKTAKVWNLNGEEIAKLRGHKGSVWDASFSQDGKFIVTASHDGTAKVWNLNGEEITTLYGHESYVRYANFSQDGKFIVTTSGDGTAKVWNSNGEEITTLAGHPDSGYSATFSRDRNLIITVIVNDSDIAKVWNLKGEEIATLEGHEGLINSVNFSRDGNLIVTACDDKTAKVWNLKGEKIATLEGHKGLINSVNFSRDGNFIVTASDDNTAKVWNLKGDEIASLQHLGSVYTANFSPDGNSIVTTFDNDIGSSHDNIAKVWNLKNEELITLTRVFGFSSVSFSRDGNYIFTTSSDWTAKVWNLKGETIATIKPWYQQNIDSDSLSKDGLIVGGFGDTAKVWNLKGDEIQTLKGHESFVNDARFNHDGKLIVTASGDNTAKVWNLNGEEIQTLRGHKDRVNIARFNHDGKLIVTASSDKTAKVWNLKGDELTTLAHEDYVFDANFSRDGNFIITFTGLDTKVWNLSGEEQPTLAGYLMRLKKDSFRKNGSFIGEELATLTWYQNGIKSDSFSQDGKFIFTTNGNTAQIWNVYGEELGILEGHHRWVSSVIIHPDDNLILTASGDNTTKVWKFPHLPELIVQSCDRLVYYFKYSPDVDIGDTNLCDRTPSSNIFKRLTKLLR